MTEGGGVNVEKFKETLLRGEYVSVEDVQKAESYAHEKNIALPDALFELKLLTKDLVGQVIAESIGLKYAEQDAMPNDRAVVQKIKENFARRYRLVLLSETVEGLVVATDQASDEGARMMSALFPGKVIEVRYTLPEHIDAAYKLYEKPLASRFEELFGSSHTSIPDIVTTIFDHAVDLKVSDIHFEPHVTDVAIRFRIDGVLLPVGRIPKPFYERILNRIKVLAQLPIDEHMRAQDGSLRHTRPEGIVNIRVSIAPTISGEKIVLRLLFSYAGFTIEELGLSAPDRATLEISAHKPFGMILSTGPTGSGKTTTLYAFIHTRNTPEINITTIEDPVEYKTEGVNQMQVNMLTDLTFARGLRSIVRQDPDIVLVGEIRDRETAEIAINAALTGHLLFSTFHSNDAATTIPRLLDMGIEPFLLSSTLELIVAQRLARKICENCKGTYTLSGEEARKRIPLADNYLKGQTEVTLYRGAGCQVCHGTGFRGRIGIFELIKNTSEMQDLIVTHPKRADIWKLAKSQGSRSLFDDGFGKVTEGVTTLEELLRVAEPEAVSSS